jgi:uracil-DNA glycosylase
LQNIYKEIEADLGRKSVTKGDLTHWANQGVLLLNSTLTVRAHAAASHAGHGWEEFTDAVIRTVAARENIVYMLWGSYAQKKAGFVDMQKNLVLKSAHPSPLSAYRGFFGNKHFSQANEYLVSHGKSPIEW